MVLCLVGFCRTVLAPWRVGSRVLPCLKKRGSGEVLPNTRDGVELGVQTNVALDELGMAVSWSFPSMLSSMTS